MTSDIDIKDFLYWIEERERIRLRREGGAAWPWTADPILSAYRFCNPRREDDRVTRWIAANWRKPNAADPDLWFAMAVARYINFPATLEALGYPVPWNREHFKGVLRARIGGTFGSAYVIPNGGSKKPKVDYLADDVLNRMWRMREDLRPRSGRTLAALCHGLTGFKGVGSFMAGQVIADIKYVEPLRSAPDWITFVVSGPGSRRGLNRIMRRPVDSNWTEASWCTAFGRLETAIRPELHRIGLGDMHAQDLQNCLCETDKFLRAKLGEGRPNGGSSDMRLIEA